MPAAIINKTAGAEKEKPMKEILAVKDVALNYHSLRGEVEAIKNLTFSVAEGEFVAIIGPSGCGKTSVLSLIAGLIEATSGEIVLGGEKVTCNRKQRSLGYMLQKDHLFPWRTIEKNAVLPLEISGKTTDENKKYAIDLLNKYGLGDFKKSYPSELSGGMRQRAALIRTLVSKPKLLLLDEPFSALDYQTRLSVCDDVYGIIRSEKKTAVLVTHDLSEAISLSDRIVVLTKRPASVMSIHALSDIPRELSPLKRREALGFQKWFETIWGELNR